MALKPIAGVSHITYNTNDCISIKGGGAGATMLKMQLSRKKEMSYKVS